MKRGIIVLISITVLIGILAFTANQWAIRRETIVLYDEARGNRPVPVEIVVRRDREMQANAGLMTIPVAILNHGNTVRHTEYSFLSNVFAARGYLVISPQHDLPTDPPMVTKPGELYVGRLPQLQRGVANLQFVLNEIGNLQPSADISRVTMVGHSMGGDISVYFASQFPDKVRRLVTLDNLRVPLLTPGKFKILSFRSRDPQFKADPGVIPSPETCDEAGISVVNTEFQHNDMRDTGPDHAKGTIQAMLDQFLSEPEGEIATPAAVARQPKPQSAIPYATAKVPGR